MTKSVWFFGATVLIVAIQALFVVAGAIDFVIREAWPFTAIAMVVIGTMFAFANRHELRVGRFIAIPAITTLIASQAIVIYAWNSVGATASLDIGYLRGVLMLTASSLPLVTVAVSWITFFFWYDWGVNDLLSKPEKTCSHCSREIPRCVSDARFCPYCGQDLEGRHG